MANITTEIARSSGDLIIIEVTYNDANFNIRGFTITNNGGSTVTATVTKPPTGSWQLIAGPNEIASDTVPANLVSFEDDGTGVPAIPHVTLGPFWWGDFGIWHWVVTA